MTDSQYDQISAYVSGTMSAEEVVQFELKLSSDSELAKALETYRLGELALRIDRRQTLLKDLEVAQARIASQPAAQIKPIWRQPRLWLAVAAAVLVALAVVRLQAPDRASGRELFAQQFEPYPVVGNLMSPDLEPNQPTPYQAYSRGNYSQAIVLFRASQQDRELSDEQRLYWANAYLALDSVSAAQQLLTPLSQVDGPFQAASQWYLALAFIREGKVAMATPILEQLKAQSTDKYGEDAQQLLNQLGPTP